MIHIAQKYSLSIINLSHSCLFVPHINYTCIVNALWMAVKYEIYERMTAIYDEWTSRILLERGNISDLTLSFMRFLYIKCEAEINENSKNEYRCKNILNNFAAMHSISSYNVRIPQTISIKSIFPKTLIKIVVSDFIFMYIYIYIYIYIYTCIYISVCVCVIYTK